MWLCHCKRGRGASEDRLSSFAARAPHINGEVAERLKATVC